MRFFLTRDFLTTFFLMRFLAAVQTCLKPGRFCAYSSAKAGIEGRAAHADARWNRRAPQACLCRSLRHKPLEFAKAESKHSYEHPRNLNKIICDGSELGVIGIAHPTVSKKIDKKAAIVFAELDVTAFSQLEDAGIVYEEPSKFPAIEIDLSFVSDFFAPIMKEIQNADCALIKKVEVVDIYADETGKSITTRLTFSHPEKTLTREEVMGVVDGVIERLEKSGIALKK